MTPQSAARPMRWLRPLLITLVTLLMASTYMYYYLCGELRGNIDGFMLTTKQFGIPEVMVKHNQTPHYQDNQSTGWDGQFYFFMANDLLGTTDAIQHMGGGEAYRYQRIGLPMTAAIVAKVTGQSWTSPKTYYFTYLALILLSTFALAGFFQSRGYSPWWTLCWSLSYGVQLTLLNGLPDAAAEAFLALTLIAYVNKRYWLYMLLATLTALTREAFIIIPAILFVCHFIADWRQQHFLTIFKQWQKYIALVVPGLVFIAWQIYIRMHFHTSPTTIAHQWGMLAWPLQGFIHFFIIYSKQLAFHPLSTFLFANSTIQLIALIVFIAMMFISLGFITYWTRTYKTDNHIRALLIASIAFLLLNICLGYGVMLDSSGSLKAINLILLLLPFLACLLNVKFKPIITVFMVFNIFLGIYIVTPRIFYKISVPVYLQFMPTQNIDSTSAPIGCKSQSSMSLKLNKIDKLNFYKHASFDIYYDYYMVNLTIYNNNAYSLRSISAPGSFNLSYLTYVNNSINPVGENPRSFLPKSIPPNQSLTMNMILLIKKGFSRQENTIVISMVQEGCQWLYLENPKNGLVLTGKQLQDVPTINDDNLTMPITIGT